MELQFEKDLDFQLEAIQSVVDLFVFQGAPPEDLLLDMATAPNSLGISESTMLQNLRSVQRHNGLEQSKALSGMNFTLEMETGTGKTYVYLRTIFELNQNYNLRKFIVVVPSVAIREGVMKSLEITKAHFRELYNTAYDYYAYDSKKLHKIKDFSQHRQVEIMVITLDSFNKDANILNQYRDTMGSAKPIEMIRTARPVLILDEPQNMESAKSRAALNALNPLFVLRYSATHKTRHNLVYRLTPKCAQDRNLVKRLALKGVDKTGDYNRPHIMCSTITATKRGISARLLVHKRLKSQHKQSQIAVKLGDDLAKKTRNSKYAGFVVSELDASNNFIRFANGVKIGAGESVGTDRTDVIKWQISEAIRVHLQKLDELKRHNIKPLTLFFIDRVAHYSGKNGYLRTHFESSFARLARNHPVLGKVDAKAVHAGYFAHTGKRGSKSPKDSLSGSTREDQDAYELIMRNKERLLSSDEPTQFIFSHSALREGWDNPNVFTICTLNETRSDIKKHQEIGRGMRLPVNQCGERVRGNFVLTIVANENYEAYVRQLNEEYAQEWGDIEPPAVANGDNRRRLALKPGFGLDPEFRSLWGQISKKTRYSVRLDSDRLICACVEAIRDRLRTDDIQIRITDVDLAYTSHGITRRVTRKCAHSGASGPMPIPDIIRQISEDTKLTRSTVSRILSQTDNLGAIFANPQSFTLAVSQILITKLEELLADGIQYTDLGEKYAMELFEDIVTYRASKTLSVKKSIYSMLAYESGVERDFAEELDSLHNIRLFVKLPGWFTVDTPVGRYNPDWAVSLDMAPPDAPCDILYMVAETKSTTDTSQLRPSEQKKIRYARRHFSAIRVPYETVTNTDDLLGALRDQHAAPGPPAASTGRSARRAQGAFRGDP